MVEEFNWEVLSNCLYNLLVDEEVAYGWLQEIFNEQKELQQKLEAAQSKKLNLETQLAQREKVVTIRQKQLEESKLCVRRERLQNKVMMRKNKANREELDALLDTLPANCKKDILAKLSQLPTAPHSSSMSIASDSSTSLPSESSSSSGFNLHLSSDESECINDNRRFFNRRLSLVSARMNGQAIKPPQDFSGVDDSSAFNERLSSSTELSSDKSSILMFPTLMDNIKNRSHVLKSRFFVMGNKCNVCHLKIGCGKKGFCCDECHANIHEKCGSSLAEPCIPTRKFTKENIPVSISDYCSPHFRPMIPAIVIHCIFEIEKRGLDQVGLYKVPEYSRKFETLRHMCRHGDWIPNLTSFKINLVCELLKHFLSSLKPSLILQSEFKCMQEFFDESKPTATSVSDQARIYDSLVHMSSPSSRNTFIFLIIHLQKVAQSPACKMSARSLSKVFTPILVENYEQNRSSYQVDKKNRNLLEFLIQTDSSHWKSNLMKFLY